jgi:hypothetical protein
MSRTRQKNRIAAMTSAAGRLLKGQPAQITASDFCTFKISDSAESCCSCDTTESPRRPVPIAIKGKHYCLWCAVAIARGLLASTPNV